MGVAETVVGEMEAGASAEMATIVDRTGDSKTGMATVVAVAIKLHYLSINFH